MKKLISVLLVCLMLICSTETVFAADEDVESYDLSELFANYDPKSLSEMVGFVSENPIAYRFVEFFCKCSNSSFNPVFFIHRAGDNIGRFPNVLEVGFTAESPKYLTSTSRVTTSGNASYDVLIGDVGDKVMSIQLERGFIEFVNSLEKVERTRMILDFLMNIAENEEVAGVSWAFSYWIGTGIDVSTYDDLIHGDCNGDGSLNAIDSNMMRKAVAGTDCGLDPFTVDMNSDGDINAKDSLLLRLKLING